MNIKLKAALEVLGIITLASVVVVGVRAFLDLAAAAYGADQVINAITFAVPVATAAYVCVGLLYDVRVARLEYRNKLNDVVKK